jgi:hypothetical protein
MGTRFVTAGAVALSLALALGAAGCGGSSSDASGQPQVIRAGQVNLQLPDGWKVTAHGASRPATGSGSGNGDVAAGAGGSTDTVPLAKEDPTTKFFKSLTIFRTCLSDLGVKFIGAPDPKNPNSPTNDPDYLKALGTCAAKSNIVQALKDEQAAQDALTPKQIETQNKGYLKWRKCMIARGWGMPDPKPDSKGRLFSFSNNGQPPDFKPPPGQDILGSSDMTECATEVQRQTGSGS